MKFLVKSSKYEELKNITRRFGYAVIFDRRSAQESLVRRLGGGHYPRFHLYLEENGTDIIFSLHLDQKKASYEGQHMHNAEYDGELVENEMSALADFVSSNSYSVIFNPKNMNKEILKKENKQESNTNNFIKYNSEDVLSSIDLGDLDRDLLNFQKNNKKKKGFFSFFKKS